MKDFRRLLAAMLRAMTDKNNKNPSALYVRGATEWNREDV